MADRAPGGVPILSQGVVALVPMRHHSERVPGKNYRPLGGRPLYEHILTTLGACPEIEQIVVDTDSPVIREGVSRDFPRVRLVGGDRFAGGFYRRCSFGVDESRPFPSDPQHDPLVLRDSLGASALSPSCPQFDSLFTVTRLRSGSELSGKPVTRSGRAPEDAGSSPLKELYIYIFRRSVLLPAQPAGNGRRCLRSLRSKPGISMKRRISRSPRL
jgi:hypothetical protein